ncbi:Putative CAP domain-containing protein [Septoria linicola]|uniref:CAP domain-containing protein n=1 Tax=Septoria linicola TaxID=215465 RepID=A0A9Q9EHJ8_9PEZI|nr:putative CAP domain-containing protein [Septoria linicola]USW50012.1 Putative CAP domain-containing protein [Septoria linicola]
MHFLYPLAALAATAMAIPAQLVEGNTVKAISNEPLLITPSGEQKVAKRDALAEAEAEADLEKRQYMTFQQRVLLHHNLHRRNHSAPDLVWNASIATSAKTLAQQCKFAHDTSIGGGGYGQNLAVGVKEANVTAVITDLWYGSEFNAYNRFYGQEPDLSTFGSYGHFTQVVWKGTTSVGCYVADCTKQGVTGVGANVGKYMTVCNYWRPGNVIGNFKTNVIRPRGDAVAKWNTGWA